MVWINVPKGNKGEGSAAYTAFFIHKDTAHEAYKAAVHYISVMMVDGAMTEYAEKWYKHYNNT
jgi:hypothetical protein